MMKTIGLIGGTGWVSTIEYYRIINQEINKRLGGLEAARCILFSLNYGEVDEFNKNNNPEGIFSLLDNAAEKLIAAGADCLLLCANTMHQFASRLEKQIDIPLLHIAKATGEEIKKKGIGKVGLLGTKQTMEMDFYKSKLNEVDITVLTPVKEERDFIQRTISEELLKNIFLEESRERFREIMKDLQKEGAGGIVLGCTEIPLLIKQEHSALPLFNTLEIHSMAAVDFALG